ncbi:MAG: hypothetical protein H6667_21785 [Ardenticatenaceae bacterium]|nr:hypothetical protein [Ardenticatenaceae bacterium]
MSGKLRLFLPSAFCLLAFLSACGNDRVVLEGPDVVFADAFTGGQTGEWLVEGDDAGRTAVLNEQLVIAIEEPQLLQYSTLAEPIFADFALEVDATQLGGDLESSYGLLFRMQNPGQFYRFDITGSGMYVVERHNGDGTWTRFLDDWTESEAIKQGLSVTNRLKVVAQGATLSFYVNDQLLNQFNDASYAAGQIALDAGTFGHGGLKVAFDNLVVRNP